MAVTENLYTGNGSSTNYSFTFPYLETTDIKVSINGTITTAYTLANPTTIQFTTAPANGAAIRIYRVTDDSALAATFYSGAAIRATDLNENFTQNLYVTQETTNYAVRDIGNVTLAANYTFNGTVSGATPTQNNHFTTKQYVDGVALAGIPDGNKGDITVTGSGTTWTLNSTYLESSDIGVSVQAYDATILNAADIGASVQAYDATYLKSADIGSTVQGYDADTVKTDVLPTFTVATRSTERTITGGAFDLATGNLWTCGAITVPNPTNAAAGQTGAIRITAGPVVWSSNFKFPGGTAPTITTFPAVIPYYVQDSSTILMGYVSEGIA